MRKAMAAIGVVWMLGSGWAWAQVPWGAVNDMGRPQHGSPYVDELGPQFWVGVDYLRWWVKPGPVPGALVTTGAATDAVPGALGSKNTAILFGQDSIHYGDLNGVRATVGWWFGGCEGIAGFEASAFWFADRAKSDGFASSPTGLPALFVPVTRTDLGGVPGAFVIASPTGPTAGNIGVNSSSQLWSGEANTLVNICRACGWQFDGLFGFRYLELNEDLNLLTATTTTGLATTTLDSFSTRNQFYGGQVGLKLLWKGDRVSVQTAAKVAVGNTHRVSDVSGSSMVGSAVSAGGLLALPSNIGEHGNDAFGLVPQGELKVAFELFPNVHLTAGYDFLYWNRVFRPGNQIDTDVNATQRLGGTLAGAPRPASLLNSSDFWAHGLSAGIEFRW